MNYSKATAWHLASSVFNVYIALTRETSALYGPLHWVVNMVVLRTLNEIGIVDHILEFVEGVKGQ